MKKILTWLTVFICVNHLNAQTGSRGVSVTATQDTTVFNGNIYAVIVGVSDYKFVKPLSFADQDALLFRDFLQSKSGGSVKPDNIILILDSDANAATQPRIRRWLTETKKLQKGDRVFFYFAGHGDAINPDEYFFLLQDCNPAGDKNNYTGGMASVIQMYNIKSLIKNELVKNGIDVVLIWDACRTNELPGGETGLKNMQEGIAEKSDGESIMLSASAGEVALENSNYAHGHGLFTYYLIDGLSGAADKPDNGGNGDGKVDMIELDDWVRRKVRVDAKTKFNVAQDPRFIYSGDETLSVVDSTFENEWAMRKISGEDVALNYKNPTKISGRNVQEADSMVIRLYNRFMESVKNDSLDTGPNSAEELYSGLLKKYPDNSLTDQAGFNLAMEYINLAQDKINLYLSGKDDITILAVSKVRNEDHSTLNRTHMISSGKNYGRNGQYINRAIALLKKDTIGDIAYIKQLQAKADFLLARSYVSNEGIITDFSKALQLAKEALTVQPKAAYNYLLFGSLFYINRQYDSSIYYVRHALALAPNWVNAINNLGIAFAAENKIDSARFYYRKAIATNPDFLIPYANLSYSFSSQNSFDSAYKYGRKAVDLNPLYADGVNNLGMIFQFQKIYDSAKSYYHIAISVDPTHTNAYNNLGILFYNQKTYDSAESYYKKAISLDPKYTDAYYNLALVFNSQKQFDSAKTYYYKLLSVDPEYADAYIGIGNIFQNQSKLPDSARHYYNKTISINPKSTYAYYNIGFLFEQKKQYDSAKIYYYKALSIDPNYTYAYNELGNAFTADKQFDSARIYYSKAIEMDSKFTDALYNFGVVLFDQNQYDSAKIYYYKAISIDPEYKNAYNELGNIFMNDQRYDSARKYFNKSISIDPHFTAAVYNLGLLFANQKQFDSAKIYYNKSISIDPKYKNAYNELGIIFMNDHQYDSARQYFNESIRIDPHFTVALYNMGLLFTVQNQFDSAKIYYHKAINTDPKFTDALNNIGFLFAQNKQYDSARVYFSKAINCDSKYTKAWCSIGFIFEQNKQYDSSKIYYRKAIGIDPEYKYAYNELGYIFMNEHQYDSTTYILKEIINHKIADASTIRVSVALSNYYQDKKSFNKEIEITRLFYDYDSVYHIPGVDSSQRRTLLNNLAFAYVNTGAFGKSKFYYEKGGYVDYYYYNSACLASLDKKTKAALENLEFSFQNGYKDYDHIQQDTDLDNIRNMDEFKQLLKKYFPDKVK